MMVFRHEIVDGSEGGLLSVFLGLNVFRELTHEI